MDDENQPSQNAAGLLKTTIYIVSSGGAGVEQQLRELKRIYPSIAQENPQINSPDSFQWAKIYLSTRKDYDSILYQANIVTINYGTLKERMDNLKFMASYLDVLQSEPCISFGTVGDKEELIENFYETYGRMGQCYLMFLIYEIGKSRKDTPLAQFYRQEIKKIKGILKGNPKYLDLLQKEIERMQDLMPLLKLEQGGNGQQPYRKPFPRIEKKKTLRVHEKLSGYIKEIPEDYLKEGFDPYYYATSDGILTEALSLSLQKIPGDVYMPKLQSLIDQYIGFEKESMRLKEKISGLVPPEPIHLIPQDLTNLYLFLHHRFSRSNKNPSTLLGYMISLFIQGGRFDDALIRTEVLKAVLLEQGPLPKWFIFFRANVLALNGDVDEWRLILEEKIRAREEKQGKLHQQTVTHIKKEIQEKKQQESLSQQKQSPAPKSEKKEVKKASGSLPPDAFDYLSPTPSKAEIPIPRKKVKTRKPGQLTPEKPTGTLEKKHISDSALSPESPKVYYVSRNAFKTYQKIRRNEWKFSRSDLCNLFDKLGCQVDISQGKGDHNKVTLPLNMTVKNAEGLVAVIPEFVNQQISMLTIPNWDEKWDGRVPSYMAKSILTALSYLNATDETVHKGSPQAVPNPLPLNAHT